jgi:hypothetical protein
VLNSTSPLRHLRPPRTEGTCGDLWQVAQGLAVGAPIGGGLRGVWELGPVGFCKASIALKPQGVPGVLLLLGALLVRERA